MQRLTLIIKKHWYDKILSGEKTKELRQIKPYYEKRLSKLSLPFLLFLRNGYAKNAPTIVAIVNKIEQEKGFFILNLQSPLEKKPFIMI